jgi:hypothetical protein
VSFVHATAGAGAFKSNFDMFASSMETKLISPPSEFKKGLISSSAFELLLLILLLSFYFI